MIQFHDHLSFLFQISVKNSSSNEHTSLGDGYHWCFICSNVTGSQPANFGRDDVHRQVQRMFFLGISMNKTFSLPTQAPLCAP